MAHATLGFGFEVAVFEPLHALEALGRPVPFTPNFVGCAYGGSFGGLRRADRRLGHDHEGLEMRSNPWFGIPIEGSFERLGSRFHLVRDLSGFLQALGELDARLLFLTFAKVEESAESLGVAGHVITPRVRASSAQVSPYAVGSWVPCWRKLRTASRRAIASSVRGLLPAT